MPRILQSAMELRCPLVEVNWQARKAKPQRSSQHIPTCEGSLLRHNRVIANTSLSVTTVYCIASRVCVQRKEWNLSELEMQAIDKRMALQHTCFQGELDWGSTCMEDLSISRDDTVGWKRKYHNSNSSSNTSTGSKSQSIIGTSVHSFNEQEPWVPNSIQHLTHPSDWQLLLGQ